MNLAEDLAAPVWRLIDVFHFHQGMATKYLMIDRLLSTFCNSQNVNYNFVLAVLLPILPFGT